MEQIGARGVEEEATGYGSTLVRAAAAGQNQIHGKARFRQTRGAGSGLKGVDQLENGRQQRSTIRQPQEVAQQLVPRLGQYTFRVELHPLQVGVVAVAQAHDGVLTILQPCGNLQAVGQGGALHHQGVVTGGGQGLGQPAEYPFLLVVDSRGLPVHGSTGTHHVSTKTLGHGLVTQAHPQHGRCGSQLMNHLQAHPRLIRVTRSRGEHHRRWPQGSKLRDGQRIVALHPQAGSKGMIHSQLPQVLHQIEGEAVVIVDHQKHRYPPAMRCNRGGDKRSRAMRIEAMAATNTAAAAQSLATRARG